MVPNLFASTNPGDLFVLRNIGNLIPPASSSPQEDSVGAALEFSIFSLNVADIIICGHSECGAMQTIAEGINLEGYNQLTDWLKYGNDSFKRIQSGFTLNPYLSLPNQLSQVNVLQQMEHIATYPFIADRIEKKQLRVHGWWFDIAQADVYCYEPEVNQFILIDEAESALILKRMRPVL